MIGWPHKTGNYDIIKITIKCFLKGYGIQLAIIFLHFDVMQYVMTIV